MGSQVEDKERKYSGEPFFKGIIDGRLLTRDAVLRQLPFIFFVVVMALLYIGNRYHAEKKARQYIQLQYEVKELRSEAITTSAELMYVSKQSVVLQLVREKGLELEESKEPPRKIILED